MADGDITPTGPCYYMGTHPDSFRSGEPGLIDSISTVQIHGERRACFKVIYGDGAVDWSPVCDTTNYKILTFNEVRGSFRRTFG